MVIHNETNDHKSNIWLFRSRSIVAPFVSITSQMITVAVDEMLVSGVHAHVNVVQRRYLWSEMQAISELKKPWAVLGDFNAIISMEEKVGGRFPSRRSMIDFNDCLNACELMQPPKIGLEFSWSNYQQGSKRILCNLDRVVFNMKWLQIHSDWGYKVGLRIASDHAPLLGGCASVPKPKNVPLRFQKMWLEHPTFMKVVQDSWAEQVHGDVAYIFMKKLKNLKQILRDWNWKVFGDVNVQLHKAENNVKVKMQMSDVNPHDQQALDDLVTAQNELNSKEVQYSTMMKQKYRIKFQAHNVVVDDSILDVIPNVITEDDQFMLEVIPEAEEIKTAVFSMDGNSAPGPDSFSGMFYKACWEIIQHDFIRVVQYCWSRKYCQWLRVLLSSAKNSVMVNGGPNGFFSMHRGLKQGDPLSPILFVLMEEVLSRGLTKLVETNKLQPMVTRNGIAPTRMLFADDIFLFSNGSKRSITNLLKLLEYYQNCLSQIINRVKSKCFIDGCSNARKAQIVELLQMELTSFPEKYLGVIIHPGRIKTATLWPMVEMMQDYFAIWKGKLLSFHDRLILIKHVLSSIPIYNMVVYKLPSSVIKECEKIMRNFLWSGNAEVKKPKTISWEGYVLLLLKVVWGLKDYQMLIKLC
ncbi:uncharacterized protein LOC113354436 [Papaver somniferum]|uniref:uncharacterized protein LOC113354436 n=1 Tax=Papaver somniferum TaxID=3469 RepID=UPI000E6FD177|nr:uncharacterized protein LOC113354436 [Papaver somniferum]